MDSTRLNSQTMFSKLSRNSWFWAAVLIVAWAGVPVLSKLATTDLNGWEMTFWINVFAFPVVALWVIPHQHRNALLSYSLLTLLKLAVIGFLGNLIYQLLYFSSYQTISAVTGSLMGRLGGLVFIGASIIFLGERPSPAYVVAALLASIGSILSTVKPGTGLEVSLTIGFVLMISATLMDTAYNFSNNAISQQHPSQQANLFVFKGATLLVIGLWALLTNYGIIHVPSNMIIHLDHAWPELWQPFVIGVFADGIGFLAFLKLLQLTDSARTTVVSAIVSVVQVALAVLFFSSTVSWISGFLAPALVLIPTAYAEYRRAKIAPKS